MKLRGVTEHCSFLRIFCLMSCIVNLFAYKGGYCLSLWWHKLALLSEGITLKKAYSCQMAAYILDTSWGSNLKVVINPHPHLLSGK